MSNEITIKHEFGEDEQASSKSSADNLGVLIAKLEASIERINGNLEKTFVNGNGKTTSPPPPVLPKDTDNKTKYPHLFGQQNHDPRFFKQDRWRETASQNGGSEKPPINADFWRKFREDFKAALSSVTEQVAGTIAAGAVITGARYMNNKANQITAVAGLTGEYLTANMRGEANSDLDSYIKSIYSSQSQYLQQQNTALHEGAYGTGGAIAGGVMSVALSTIGNVVTGHEVDAVKGLLTGSTYTKGAVAGGTLGAAYGKLSATDQNQRIELSYAMTGQIAANRAHAAQTEWGTSYSRWGSSMSRGGIMDDLGVSYDKHLEQMYGYGTKNGQNYNQVVDFSKYLTVNPLDQSKTGDLGQAIQNFKQAGVSVGDLGKVAIQTAQYQAMTGKTVQDFSKVYQDAAHKFGALFSPETMQNALGLQQLGYGSGAAQSIAFQSQFNPNQQSIMANYRNQDVGSYYTRQILSKQLGFDVNASMAKGEIVGATPQTIKRLKTDMESVASGKPNKDFLNNVLPWLTNANLSPDQLTSMLNHATAGTMKGGASGDAGLSPAEQIAEALTNGLKNITNMTVTAQNVMIINNGQISTMDTYGQWGDTSGSNGKTGYGAVGDALSGTDSMPWAPVVGNTNYSPTKSTQALNNFVNNSVSKVTGNSGTTVPALDPKWHQSNSDGRPPGLIILPKG